ncbi:MAG: hypothetical protein JWO95_2510 [Verrucomicrobiales bacterium]|nr:hypothetical protein [Verrucomicrobiales bacterium]
MGFLFTRKLAALRADSFGGGKVCAGVKPTRESGAARERRSFTREICENGLRYVLREVGVAVGLPQGRGIDEVEMTAKEFRKGIFVVGIHEPAEKFAIIAHFIVIAPADS